MSDTNAAEVDQQSNQGATDQDQGQQQPEQKTFTEAEVQEMISGLKAKNDELKGEKVKVSERLTALEKQRADTDKAKLEENKEFQSLWELEQNNTKAAKEEAEEARKEAQQLRQAINDKDIDDAAGKIGGGLAKTDVRKAALLAEKARQFIKHTDDGIKYEIGGVEVSAEKVSEHLKAEFDFLTDGNLSNGGGAAGSRGGSAATAKKGADAKAKGDVVGYISAQFN